MSPRYLLDIRICLRIARKPCPHFARRLAQLRMGDVGLSVITFGELSFAARSRPVLPFEAPLARLAELVPIVPLTVEACARFAKYRVMLAQRNGFEGHEEALNEDSIGINGLWLAAHAQSLGATIVSTTAREIVPGLAVTTENWLAHFDASRRRRAS